MCAEHISRVTSGSRRDQVAAALRTAIATGELQPGDRLLEPDLAERFGVSRAPLREALRQIENEGLVVSEPYKATVVLGISQIEIDEILIPIRLVLERFALTHALPNLTDDDFDRLNKLVDQMSEHRDDLDAAAQADLDFHELIMQRSGQPHCLQIWQLLRPRIWAYFRRDAPAHGTSDKPATEHARLLRALRSGDEAKALKELERHIRAHPRH